MFTSLGHFHGETDPMTQVQATHNPGRSLVAIKDVSAGRSNPKKPKNAGAQGGTTTIAATTDSVLKAFNTWAYKREQPYPSGEGRLVRVRVDDRDCAYGQPYAQPSA